VGAVGAVISAIVVLFVRKVSSADDVEETGLTTIAPA